MMSFRPCKKVHTFPLLKCSKIKYLILIPAVCILVCVCIPFVSFADSYNYVFPEVNITYTSSYYGANLSRGYPEWHYNDSIRFDLTSENSTIPVNRYLLLYTKNLNTRTRKFYMYSYINPQGYDYFTNTFLFVMPTNYSDYNDAINIQFQTLNENSTSYSNLHTIALSFDYLMNNNSYSDLYGTFLWVTDSITVSDNNNNSMTITSVSMGSSNINASDSDRLMITWYSVFQENANSYCELLMPIFAYKGFYSSGGDTSDDSSSSGSGVDLSEIEDELSDLNAGILDTISAVNDVQSEVSQLGDDISQGFDDLNSAEESRHNEMMNYLTSNDESLEVNSELESELEEFEDTTSIYNEYEQSLDNIIDGALSDFSYDTSEFYDNINNAFSELNNDTSDISFVAFVESLWNFTGISTFLPIIGGFMVLAVLLKFVIGGVV